MPTATQIFNENSGRALIALHAMLCMLCMSYMHALLQLDRRRGEYTAPATAFQWHTSGSSARGCLDVVI